MSMNFDAAAIFGRISARVEAVVAETSQIVATSAAEKAPQRKDVAGQQIGPEGRSIAGRFERALATSVYGAIRGTSSYRIGTNPNVENQSRMRWEVSNPRAIVRIGRVRYMGGALKHSIKASPVSGEGGVFTSTVSAGVSYARYVEFGTRHNRAQPFLQPAIEEQRSAWMAALAKAVGG